MDAELLVLVSNADDIDKGACRDDHPFTNATRAWSNILANKCLLPADSIDVQAFPCAAGLLCDILACAGTSRGDDDSALVPPALSKMLEKSGLLPAVDVDIELHASARVGTSWDDSRTVESNDEFIAFVSGLDNDIPEPACID
jgi:hypothetical protein